MKQNEELWNHVLTAKTPEAPQALSDEELEKAAGGFNMADALTKRFICGECGYPFEKTVSPTYAGNVQREAQDAHGSCKGLTGHCTDGKMIQQV